jgi:hypothetical protein
MCSIKPDGDSKWLILGDFNLIYKACDKRNRNLNLRLMRSFRQSIEFCELKELRLQNRKYTWSNERRRPTLVRLDWVFCNQHWDMTFHSCTLYALSSSHSDHCPLLLASQAGPRRSTPFKFENFWTWLPYFHDTVLRAWIAPTTHIAPHRLNSRTCGHSSQISMIRYFELGVPQQPIPSRSTGLDTSYTSLPKRSNIGPTPYFPMQG